MQQIDRDLHKLAIARADRMPLAFVHLSAGECAVIALEHERDMAFGALEECDSLISTVLGRGATAKEALESARRNSEGHIALQAAAFRKERTATVAANTALVSAKVSALQDAADERIERKAIRKRRTAD